MIPPRTDESTFEVGDLVTCDGTDVHRVVEVDDDFFCVTVVCEVAPPRLEHNLWDRMPPSFRWLVVAALILYFGGGTVAFLVGMSQLQ